jgi:DNA-binding transcriptional LysR family regulator
MELTTLQAFVKVVQAGSFTRAADALGTQKAHLSRVITQLEKELGVRLLERTTRALSLTEIGREFFERAVGILASVDDAQRAVQQAQGEPRGTLRLTCGAEFGMIAVSGWIDRYLAEHPQVRVDADFTSRVVDIVHEGFDLAIRLGALADSTLTARRLGELRYALYAAPGYLARRGVPGHPADLSSHDLLAFSGGDGADAWALSRDGARHGVTRDRARHEAPRDRATQRVPLAPRLRANNVFALCDAARRGRGIALLPCIVAGPALATGELVEVLPGWTRPAVPVHAVFASARYLTPKVRAFIDLAVREMAAPPAPAQLTTATTRKGRAAPK